MAQCSAVIGPECGNLDACIMFVAEAPGRLGADRTRIPLFGDKTGDNFSRLLQFTDWTRDDVFVTNAILCNPRDTAGRNATPTLQEVRNCVPILKATMELVNPRVVVALGCTALRSLDLIERHGLSLRSHVGQAHDWCNRQLVPLYHPGPRALIHRSMNMQLNDFLKLRSLF